MTAAKRLQPISVEDYLAGELDSPVKHEYVGGAVHAMAGASNLHNLIAGNFFLAIHQHLGGEPCEPYNSDTKVRIQYPTYVRFYYPDGMVVCDENPRDDSFQDNPVVVAEVLSSGTRRIDGGEKLEAYLTMPSLRVYLMIEQDEPAVVAHRRTDNGFVRELYTGMDAVIPLPEIGVVLPLADLYRKVVFSPEALDES
jgi:Uma2 family endonuclease